MEQNKESNQTAIDVNVLTIAQALRKIKKLKGEIGIETQRAHSSISYVEGAVPDYNFKDSTNKRASLVEELLNLEEKVAVANAITKITFNDGVSLTLSGLIRRMQEIKSSISFYEALVLRKPEEISEYVYDDNMNKNVVVKKVVQWKSDISVVEKDAAVKELKDRFDNLNNILETMNHSTKI